MSRWIVVPLGLLLSTWAASTLSAASPCACGAAACQTRTIEKTVMVPHVTWEERTIPVTLCRPEVRERVVTVPQTVPVVRQVTKPCVVMKPVLKIQTVTCCVNKPVTEMVQKTICVTVPHRHTVPCTRTVYRQVPYTETRYVCEDQGHWEERPVCRKPCTSCAAGSSCAACAPCTQKVWVANIVRKPVEVTCYRTVCEQIPDTRVVTVMKQETRTIPVPCVKYVPTTITKQIPSTSYVCETVMKTVSEVSCRVEMVEKVERCTVMVPYTAEKTIRVPVCRMVPKTIVCQVPVCDACCP